MNVCESPRKDFEKKRGKRKEEKETFSGKKKNSNYFKKPNFSDVA